MQSQLNLDPLVGKLVKAVFRETPDASIEIRKGKLVGFDEGFIQLRSLQNVHIINRRHIVVLKVFGCNEGGPRPRNPDPGQIGHPTDRPRASPKHPKFPRYWEVTPGG